MSEKEKNIARLRKLREHLAFLASAFAHAYGKTPAYDRILSGLNDANAVLDYLKKPVVR